MESVPEIRKIAFIGSYFPRRCGIATFTSDLLSAVTAEHPNCECSALPVNDIEEGYDYPEAVRFEIQEQDLASYERAADFLNLSNIGVVSLQHEFGIFGGPAGRHIVTLLRALKMPVVTTLHTVLDTPSAEQRFVMRELITHSARLVVMSEKGDQILKSVYDTPPEKIDVIPHGIPDLPFVDPNYYKDNFGVEGKLLLLTFGLLSPNKGIEYVLKALPAILAEFPDVVYIVLGATHPNLVREQGEAYRVSLERLARKNKVQKNVIFHNRFVTLEELKEFIGAADLYLTPYLTEAQITSGTLAYAFGCGKAVISTPYWHAAELLSDQRGVIVPFKDSGAISREVLGLLHDETRRHAMRKRAYTLGREMIWPCVAQLYMRSFERARLEGGFVSRRIFRIKTLDQEPSLLPDVKLDHLSRMTDSTGIFQHAVFTVPNFAEGYCTDDNARALALTVLLEELGEEPMQVRNLATTYLAFLNHALDRNTMRFRNFMGFDRNWREEVSSEDTSGRALWALGMVAGRSQRPSFQSLAGNLFITALPAAADFKALRGWAWTLLGIQEYMRRFSGDRLAGQTRELLSGRLMQSFEECNGPDWPWCEDKVTYDNARLAQALLVSGVATGRLNVLDTGLTALRWLTEIQSSSEGYFRPIGSNGFYPRGGPRADFDQQPIEAWAIVSACLDAHRVTGSQYWADTASRAFDWFLGWNDLGLELYSPNSGGCFDALHMDRVNRNMGAESTISFLFSLAEMKLALNDESVPPVEEPERVKPKPIVEHELVGQPA